VSSASSELRCACLLDVDLLAVCGARLDLLDLRRVCLDLVLGLDLPAVYPSVVVGLRDGPVPRGVP